MHVADRVAGGAWSALAVRAGASRRQRAGRALLAWSVIVMAAAIPTSMSAMGIAFAGMVAGAVIALTPVHRVPGFAAGLAFAAALAAAGIASAVLSGSWRSLPQGSYLTSWLVVPLAAVAFADAAVRQRALVALAAGLAVNAAHVITAWTAGHGPGGVRVDGLVGGALTQGLVAALALTLCAALVARARPTPTAVVMAAGAAIALIASSSRMAWLALSLSIAAVFAVRTRRGRIALAAGVLSAGIGAAVLGALDPSRANALLHGRDGRWYIWRVAGSLLADHPVLGVGGRESFTHAYPPRWQALIEPLDPVPREPRVLHAHNTLLAFAVEHGPAAAIAYVAFIAAILRGCWRARRERPLGWRLIAPATVAWMAAAQFNHVAGRTQTAFAFYLLAGCALALAGSTGAGAPGAGAGAVGPAERRREGEGPRVADAAGDLRHR
ncbi:MAG TPA: O-antigen ligase family protein [Planctomycetota bacterium]|nr:O-antigen ligase family protein [Planctomycetota bacterium]